jgi:hypothetical protein
VVNKQIYESRGVHSIIVTAAHVASRKKKRKEKMKKENGGNAGLECRSK